MDYSKAKGVCDILQDELQSSVKIKIIKFQTLGRDFENLKWKIEKV